LSRPITSTLDQDEWFQSLFGGAGSTNRWNKANQSKGYGISCSMSILEQADTFLKY
jgi:hypothetical protein